MTARWMVFQFHSHLLLGGELERYDLVDLLTALLLERCSELRLQCQQIMAGVYILLETVYITLKGVPKG